MSVLPPEPSSPLRGELVDLLRGPLLLASTIGIGFEALSHLIQTVIVVVVIGGVAMITTLAMRGRQRYPYLYSLIFAKTQVATKRAPRDDGVH